MAKDVLTAYKRRKYYENKFPHILVIVECGNTRMYTEPELIELL